MKNDISKIIVVERHKNTHHIGLGFIKCYDIKSVAVASSIGHDSHNIIAVGVNDEDLVIDVIALKENKDRIVVVFKNEKCKNKNTNFVDELFKLFFFTYLKIEEKIFWNENTKTKIKNLFIINN